MSPIRLTETLTAVRSEGFLFYSLPILLYDLSICPRSVVKMPVLHRISKL